MAKRQRANAGSGRRGFLRRLGASVAASLAGPAAVSAQVGHWELRFVGHTDHGRRIITRVAGERDPGYGSTARMLGEAGACLALDLADSKAPGDFWTPASLLGDRLIARLRRHAGVRFDVLEPEGKAG